jgi:cyclin H
MRNVKLHLFFAFRVEFGARGVAYRFALYKIDYAYSFVRSIHSIVLTRLFVMLVNATTTMADYPESSQANKWLFKSPSELEICRSKANLKARAFLAARSSQQTNSTDAGERDSPIASTPPPVEHFGSGFSKRLETLEAKHQTNSHEAANSLAGQTGHEFLTVSDEQTLVRFYASKLPSLIGPAATVPRLRRESKVTATAALLFRRFFLSNSVMLFDPKALMVAAAFLASKVQGKYGES